MTKREATFENLRQLLGGYFHQDWHAEATSWDEQLRSMGQHEARERLSAALVDIEKLLERQHTEAEIAQILSRDLGCDFYPPGVGLSYHEWLNQVRVFLRRITSQ
jgi:hypothetical protein